MKHQDFCLLVNPFAGRGRTIAILNQIKSTLATLPVHFHTVITESVEHANQVIDEAVDRDESIVALGGDGTVRAISNKIHQLKGRLAVIPAGRGNDLARTLKIPKDPIAACKVIAQRHLTQIDMAKIDGQCFLGICSVGFDSVANRFASATKLFKGANAYLYGGLCALFTWRAANFLLNIDGKELEHKGYTVAIANAPCYGGGMYLAPQAKIDDGLLDIVLIDDIPKFKFLINIPRIFTQSIAQAPGITFLRGKNIEITTDPKYTLYADGDPIGPTPLKITVVPKALEIYTPSI